MDQIIYELCKKLDINDFELHCIEEAFNDKKEVLEFLKNCKNKNLSKEEIFKLI